MNYVDASKKQRVEVLKQLNSFKLLIEKKKYSKNAKQLNRIRNLVLSLEHIILD